MYLLMNQSLMQTTLFFMLFLINPIVFSTALFSQDSNATSLSITNRLHNCEVELNMLKKSIESQEDSCHTLERDVRSLMKQVKESSKDSSSEAIKKAQGVEKQLDKLVSDMKQIKTHSNDLANTINDISTTVSKLEMKLETKVEQQAKSIQALEKAMRSLTLALKGGSSQEIASGTMYTVQSGDSLEKIAKKHHTSVQVLKEVNNLSSNTIRKGQKLQIPQSAGS